MSLIPPGRVSAAALLALPWSLLVAVQAIIVPPTPANWAAADPILHVLPRGLTVWGVPALGVAIAAAWFLRARPSAADLRWSIVRGLLGIVSAGLIVGAIRILAG
ncbi:MAG: hypothetical protein D6798_00385, partial [Deltaproteobacteria bacterium]